MSVHQNIIDQIKHSSSLPLILEELNSFWQDEQQRRNDFYSSINEDSKAEFIDGVMVVHSPAKDKHNEAVALLGALVCTYVNKNEFGIARLEKALVKLTRNDFEPDICFFSNIKAEEITPETMFYPTPDWVCEVLSSSTSHYDRGVKKEDYAAHGISEYWLVDTDKQEVEQYVLNESGSYELEAKSGNGFIHSTIIHGMKIPTRAIFDPKENIAALTSILNA